MVKAKFFGLLRLDLKSAGMECEAATVEELLTKVAASYPISVAELRNLIIIVRGKNISELKRFKTELQAGDEVMFMNPVSGG